jgi:D-serine deaminase-like pyridoxal phosphate-dependent protein
LASPRRRHYDPDRRAALAGDVPWTDSRHADARGRAAHIEGLSQLPLLLEKTLGCESITEEIAKRSTSGVTFSTLAAASIIRSRSKALSS